MQRSKNLPKSAGIFTLLQIVPYILLLSLPKYKKIFFGCASIPRCRSCMSVCVSVCLYVCLIFENMLAWPYLDQSEGIKDWPIKIHYSLPNQEALWLDQSGGTLAWSIRRHFGLTNQEALWCEQSGGTLARPIRRHSGLANQEASKLNQSRGNPAKPISRH